MYFSLKPSAERWYVLSSLVRRYISFSTSSGTLVVHLQWNVGVFCYMIIVSGTSMYFSLIPSMERWYVLSSVVRRYISFSTSSGMLVVHLQWNVGVFCYMIIVSGTSMYFSL